MSKSAFLDMLKSSSDKGWTQETNKEEKMKVLNMFFLEPIRAVGPISAVFLGRVSLYGLRGGAQAQLLQQGLVSSL